MNERQANIMTPAKESEPKDLGLMWINCPHHQEEVLSIEKALVGAKACVHSGRASLRPGKSPTL